MCGRGTGPKMKAALFFVLPALVRMGHYTLITNIPQVSVTKTVQFYFLQHISTGGGL